MKFNQSALFEQHLHNADQPKHTIYLLINTNDYERRNILQKAIEAVSQQGESAIAMHDAETISVILLQEELEALSLFASHKLLVLQEVDKLKGPALQLLEHYCAHPHTALSLVMTAAAFPASSALYKHVDKEGCVLDVAALKPWEREKELVHWLIAEAQAQRKSLNQPVAQLMVQRSGMNKQWLSTELEKLICYVGERAQLTQEDIDSIGVKAQEEVIWEFCKAIFQRRAAAAACYVQELIDQEMDALALLAQLRSQFQRGLHICSLLSQGGAAHDITKAYPYLKGNLLGRTIETAQQYGAEKLRQGLVTLYKAEIACKSQVVSPEALLDSVIVKLCR
jgi:DNA polymerase III subunit delta